MKKVRMKRLTALLLAAALTVTAVPVAVFAEDAPGDPPAVTAIEKIDIDSVLERYGASFTRVYEQLEAWGDRLEEIAAALGTRFLEAYGNALQRVSDAKGRLESFETDSKERLQAYLEELNGYIELANELRAAYDENQTLQENLETVSEELKGIVTDLRNAVNNWIEQAFPKDADDDAPGFIEKVKTAGQKFFENVKGQLLQLEEKIKTAKAELENNARVAAIAEGLKGFIEEAKTWSTGEGIDLQTIRELFSQSETLNQLIAAYQEAGMPAALNELVKQAKAAFQSNASKVSAYIQKQSAVLKKVADAALDPILKRLGTSREEVEAKLQTVKDLVADIVAYGNGVSQGFSYSKLVERLTEAETNAGKLKIENDVLKLLGGNLTKALEQAAKQTVKDKVDSSNLKNVITVLSGKPKLTSVKTKAGKKITVQWKAIKGAKISFYQVSIGNKVVKVSAKTLKLTQKNKAVKKILKKIKAGKKVKVTVRAAYKLGKTTYYSKWAKAKKVKIK